MAPAKRSGLGSGVGGGPGLARILDAALVRFGVAWYRIDRKWLLRVRPVHESLRNPNMATMPVARSETDDTLHATDRRIETRGA